MNGESQKQIKIGTLNTAGVPFFSFHPEGRFHALSEALSTMELDIVNLQEVHTYRLLNILRDKLSSYPYVSYERSLWGAKGGLVTFSKMPMIKVSYSSYSGQSNQPLSFRTLGLGDKGILLSHLQELPLAVINTHLTANLQGDWSNGSELYSRQEQQIEELTDSMRRASLDGDTVIVAGDFNIAKGSELYRRFVYRSNAHDVFADEVHPTFHQEFLPQGRESHCIDYIFVLRGDRGIEIDQTSLLFQERTRLPDGQLAYLSDHVGIATALELPIQ